MRKRIIMKLATAIFTVVSLTVLFGYAYQKRDPFYNYRDFIKKPLNIIKPDKIKHFAQEEALIRAKLKLELSKKERTILAGLHWVLLLVDDEDAFKFLFPDWLLFMDKMSNANGRIHQKKVADLIIKNSFARGEKLLDQIFKEDDMSRWRFIGLFPILRRYPEYEERYYYFYSKKWTDLSKVFYVENTDFTKAIKENNYQALFDYLVWPSFLHYYLSEVKNPPIMVPKDLFPVYLKEFKNFDYKDHPIGDSQFRDLGYLSTHVILALTNYGQLAIPSGENTDKVKNYIEYSFEKTRKLGEFDLFAEYIQCIKILEPKNDQRINKLESFIYDLQRPDGSWGSKNDFETNPYTAIHPTGAALMAVNQE